MTDVITITDNTLVVPSTMVETVEVGYVAQTVSSGGGVPASTVTDETAYGTAKAVGTATSYAREDHTHGSPALGATGTTAAAGNHGHAGVYDASGAATSAVAAHVAASDPHGDRAYASGLVTSETSARTTADGLLVAKATVTTKGDLLAATGNAAIARLAVGSNGQVLTADSTQTTGAKWATSTRYTLNPAIYGLVALSHDPMNSQGSSDPGNNTIWGHRVWVDAGVPLAGLWVAVNGRGTWDAVTNGSTIGLFDDTGVQTDAIVANNALWSGAGSAWCGGALAGGTIAGGSGRFVYILALARGMTGLTLAFPNSPNDAHGGYAAVPVGGGNRRAFYVAGSSTLPASFNPTSVGTATGYGAVVGAS